MSFPIPILDDTNYDELLQEALQLIPKFSPEWTHYNPSDPGITLLELFAWITENTIYQIDQLPESYYLAMLKLIGFTKESSPQGGQENLEEVLHRAANYVSDRHRGVSEHDYAELAVKAMKEVDEGLEGKAITVVNRNLKLKDHSMEKPGHVSVILLPSKIVPGYCDQIGLSSQDLNDKVRDILEPARLLTDRLNLVSASMRKVGVRAWLVIEPGGDWQGIEEEAQASIKAMTDLFTGGDGTGWPLGRGLYRSELYELFGSIDGVERVQSIHLTTKADAILIEEHSFLEIELELRRSY